MQSGAGEQRDAPDEVCDGQAAQPSQVISGFAVHERERATSVIDFAAALAFTSFLAVTPQFTTAGWGSVRVGVAVEDVSSALHGEFGLGKGFATTDGCQYWLSTSAPGIRFMVEDGRVVRIDTDSSRYATLSGVRVGDTEASVQRVYEGRAVIKPHKYSPTGHYFVVSTRDGRRAVVIETDDEKVVGIRSGEQPAVEYVEGCS